MRVEPEKLKSALDKAGELAALSRDLKVVLLKTTDSDMEVCFSSGRQGMIETIECELDDSDRQLSLIVELSKISGIVDNCVSNDSLVPDALEIKIEENQLKISSTKRYSENHENAGDIASSMNYDIVILDNTKMNYALLMRTDYKSMLQFSGETDEWDKNKLIKAVSISKNSKSTVYMSKNMGIAFSTVTSYTHTVNIEDSCKNNTVILDGQAAKAIAAVLRRVKEKEVYLNTDDNKYVIINNGDGFAVWFEMSKGSRVESDSASLYKNMEFKDLRLLVNRDAMANAIQSRLFMDKQDKQIISIKNLDEGVAIVIEDGLKNSSNNGVKTFVAKAVDDRDLIDNFKASAIISVIKSALEDFKGSYCKMSIHRAKEDDDSYYILKMEDIIEEEVTETIYTLLVKE